MCQACWEVIENLAINIELFLQNLNSLASKKAILTELDKLIVCQSLLGFSRQQIAEMNKLRNQNVGDRLTNNIYPKIAELMNVEQEEVAGNWVKIMNFLLEPKQGYKLNPAPQLNSDNFQGSFGRQFFLYPPNQEIVKFQIEATKFYQLGLYYQALQYFLMAWNQEIKLYGSGNPEVLIYINNCLIEYKKLHLQENGFKIYTLAVVVPFYHNQGNIAAETLRGIAQIQLQVNLFSFEKIALDREINLDIIKPQIFFSIISSKIALQILIVNDPNNLYTPYNQTAEKLAELAQPLNLIAIIGHYSSEMTKNALQFYAQKGLVLVNSSSTSNELSDLSLVSFFRLTTPDMINAEKLADYLIQNSVSQIPSKLAIIYNQNSIYSTSYRNSIKKNLKKYQDFIFLEECNYISESYYQVQKYIEYLKKEGADIIIIIPDGGIEPNSLNNAALISRLNIDNCLIAGTATFYQENVLHWIHEHSQTHSINQENCQIIACIPWHWHSQENGCNSSNNHVAQSFCQTGAQLWGEENLNWRSATAFDSVLIILKTLDKYHSQDSQSLLADMNSYFKKDKKQVKGVTGNIQFDQNGDRLNPPAEIVAVKWNAQQQKWQWTIK